MKGCIVTSQLLTGSASAMQSGLCAMRGTDAWLGKPKALVKCRVGVGGLPAVIAT